MNSEEIIDLCLTNIDYSLPYPLDSFSVSSNSDESEISPNSTHTPINGLCEKSYLQCPHKYQV